MNHPFINNLSTKTLEELQETISGLMQKLTFAYRTGNGPMINQLKMALESYNEAYSLRINEMMNKQKINTKISIENDNT
jgi:hypothetical protein